jgi:hypothetical protein
LKSKLFFCCIFVLGKFLYGQENLTIKGIITTLNFEPIPSTNISLTPIAKTESSKGTISNEKGFFQIDYIKKGVYILEISHLGYKTFTQKVLVNKDVDLNIINLINVNEKLDTVIIESKRLPIIKRDKIIVTIKNSIYAKGENGYSVLNAIPEILTDGFGKIKYRNEQSVSVSVDGKNIRLKKNQLSGFLSSIPSEEIESIEVTPIVDSTHGASGNSALINITLKEEYKYGLRVRLNSYYEQHRFPGVGSGIGINYSKGKINFSTLYSFSVFNFFSDIDQFQTFGNNRNTFVQDDNYTEQYYDHNLSTGIDYGITNKDKIGFRYNLEHVDWVMRYKSLTQSINSRDVLESAFRTNTREDEFLNNQSFGFFYNRVLDTIGGNLQISADYVKFKNPSIASFDNRFLNSDFEQIDDTEVLGADNPININIRTLGLAIKKTIRGINIKTGLKYSSINTNNQNIFFEELDNQRVVDDGRSNIFNYEEDIFAAYLSSNKSWGKWSIKGGLRLENTIFKGSTTGNNENNFSRNRVDFFPTLFVQNSINKKNQINLSVTRRIQRPDYQKLNPFIDFRNPFNFSTGNPNLTPSYIFKTELNYTFNRKYSLVIGHRRTSDIINNILLREGEQTTISTYDNIGTENKFFVTLSMPFKIRKWWSLNTFINVFNKEVNISEGQFSGNFEQATYFFQINNRIKLGKKTFLSIGGYYQSKSLFSIYETLPQGAVNVSLKKAFFKNRLSTFISFNDIFLTQKSRTEFNFNDSFRRTNSTFTSRSVKLNVSYNLRSSKKKPLDLFEKEEFNQDEKDRI